MTKRLRLPDEHTREDLRVFLERLQRAGEGEVRLVTRGKVLAVFGCTQAPQGIVDPLPVVLVMRGFALAEAPNEPIDVTVLGRALLDRLARRSERLPLDGAGPGADELDLPEQTLSSAWAGVLPPSGGWQNAGEIDAALLVSTAEQGIAEVANALPDQPGDHVVRAVRERVWGAEISAGVPAAAAFAAETMGFLRGERTAALSVTRSWLRVSTSRGQVLVRATLR